MRLLGAVALALSTGCFPAPRDPATFCPNDPADRPATCGGPLTISGQLPPEEIKAAVRPHFVRIAACYEEGLRRRPTFQGEISFHISVEGDGSVSKVSEYSDVADPPVVDCIAAIFRALSFPPPHDGRRAVIVFPVRLRTAKASGPAHQEGSAASASGW